MKRIVVVSSLILLGLPAIGIDYSISPGQSVTLGSDKVTCVSAGARNPDLFVGFKRYSGCEENGEVSTRFLIDWSDKKLTQANCEKNGINRSIGSFRIGGEACRASFSGWNYCHELVDEIFGE